MLWKERTRIRDRAKKKKVKEVISANMANRNFGGFEITPKFQVATTK